MLEQERLRIARDIHDDLGARVTQISLLSAMAYDNPKIQEDARVEFSEISRMSRDLVSALYETVWAVSRKMIIWKRWEAISARWSTS
ncbi:MAG: histidine kinase [Limisphaerales bacterium]